MKKFLAFTLMLMYSSTVVLAAFAQEASNGGGEFDESLSNLKRGGHNVKWGWVEIMDHTGQEAAKGNSTGEHITGVIAGSAIGVRKGIHRIGAGAIDLLTFWIPKKQPLITPEKPRLE